MSFVAAVASEVDSQAALERALRGKRESGEVSWAAHEGHAVAWNARHPWVSSHDDGDVLVVLDGQLHNLFDADRRPVALLAERYHQRGSDLGRGLVGDFVIVVLDRSRKRLMVVRDPVGVRPWYQSTRGSLHSGASDLATLVALPWVDNGVDERQALIFLADMFRSQGRTLYRGVSTLLPGCTWESSGHTARIWRHHTWDIRPETDLTWEEAVQRCRELLDEAVRSRIRAAGGATSELSGGLDSSAVTGTAVLLGAEDVLVGRLVFDDPGADERSYSDEVIKYWGLRALSVAPWILNEQEALDWTLTLRRPIPDPNFAVLVPLLRAFRCEGRTSVMTGLGGDDAFLLQSRRSRVASAVRSRQFDVLSEVIAADLRHPRTAWRGTWRGMLGYHFPRRLRRPQLILIPPRAAKSAGLADLLRERAPRLTADRAVDERWNGLTSGYLASILEERALLEETAGCRNAHPFLDSRFIAGTYGLNPWFPARDGHDRALEVAAYGDRLPEPVRNRRTKADFGGVYRNQALLQGDALTEQILGGPLIERGWVGKTMLRAAVDAARLGSYQAVQALDRARSLDRWLRHSSNG